MRHAACKPQPGAQREFSLKQMCFHAARKHVAALDSKALLDLPAALIRDLVPHLTAWQLDELQPALNHRGVSTLPGWVRVLQDVTGPHQSTVLYTEEEAKHEAMRMLFTSSFYGFVDGFTAGVPALNPPSFLWTAAKCVKQFVLMAKCHEALQTLAAGQRPLLKLLEKRIQSVGVSQSIDMSKRKQQIALYVLHRLLDHGRAEEVAVRVRCPTVLAWLLHGRGSRYVMPELGSTSQTAASDVTACKRLKMDSGKANISVDPQVLCQTFSACGPSAEGCPWGQIRRLTISQCGSHCLRLLTSALPTFFSLRSLTLHSQSTFRDSDVLDFARALKQLSESSQSVLTDLSVGVLPYTGFLEILLDANPKVTSLQVDIETVMCGPHLSRTPESELPELPLEKLTVKLAEIQTDLHVLTSVLRRSPHLTSLHVAGMRLPSGSSQSQLLATLSEVNLCLTSLRLEDMNLSDCLPAILTLLSNCKLEELRFSDCRLLEKWTDPQDGLQQLVLALKSVPSLHTLSLAQNRLARNTHVLAKLFSGSSPSSVKHLDIRSNFIKPADLLEFAERLQTHRPTRPFTLDLRMNPGDRDPDAWNAALGRLHPFCVVLVEKWKSTDSMVDHISNM